MNKLSIIALSTVVVGAYAFFYIQNKPVEQVNNAEQMQQVNKDNVRQEPEPQPINTAEHDVTNKEQETSPTVAKVQNNVPQAKQLQLVPPSSELDARAPTSQNFASQPRQHGHEQQSNDPRNNAPRPPGEPKKAPVPQRTPAPETDQ